MSPPLASEIDAQVTSQIIHLAHRHGWMGGDPLGIADWLEERLQRLEEHERILNEAKIEPPDEYGASRVDHRPPGKFARGLRQAQALSASQAMVLLAARLEQANQVIESQERELNAAVAAISRLSDLLHGRSLESGEESEDAEAALRGLQRGIEDARAGRLLTSEQMWGEDGEADAAAS